MAVTVGELNSVVTNEPISKSLASSATSPPGTWTCWAWFGRDAGADNAMLAYTVPQGRTLYVTGYTCWTNLNTGVADIIIAVTDSNSASVTTPTCFRIPAPTVYNSPVNVVFSTPVEFSNGLVVSNFSTASTYYYFVFYGRLV